MPRLAISVAGVLVASAVGCGAGVEGGLASAPSLSRFSRSDPQAPPHDPLSNGGESCARSSSGATPLRGRMPPCPRVEASARGSTSHVVTVPEAADERAGHAARAPLLPSATPMGPCAAWTLASWQLDPSPSPSSERATHLLCGTACAPSLIGCAAGWRRVP